MGADFLKEVLPNLGPDIGFTILAADDPKQVPLGLFALGVKSLPKEAPVDQLLHKSIQFFAGLAIFEYNRKNADPIRIRSVQQGSTEVKYLVQDKLFPAGFQPALALKDGYLLLATAPEAIAKFRAQPAGITTPGEVPLVKISPPELARLMKQRRDLLLDQMVQKGKESPAAAGQILDGLIEGLDLFHALHFVHRAGDHQSALILRLIPAKK